MTYADPNYSPKVTVSNKLLHDKAFNIAKILKYDGYQHGFASMKFFDKRFYGTDTSGSAA